MRWVFAFLFPRKTLMSNSNHRYTVQRCVPALNELSGWTEDEVYLLIQYPRTGETPYGRLIGEFASAESAKTAARDLLNQV